MVFLALLWMIMTGPSARAEGEPPVQQPGRSVEEIVKMRDPFQQLPGIFKESEMGPRSELEKYQLTDFKMAAVMTGPTKKLAMVLAPNGKTYYVAVNDRIGNRNGKIVKITTESIEVEERVLNLLGNEESISTTLQLPADQSWQVPKTEGAGGAMTAQGPAPGGPILPIENKEVKP